MLWWNPLAFSMIQRMLGIWTVVPLPLRMIWKFSVHVLLKSSLKDFEHNLTSMWNEYNCTVVWTFFGSAFLWDWNENWPFPVLCHWWVFPICWHTECSTFTASSFRIWNRSPGVPSPPLALLPNVHLTLHSRISGSRLVITPSSLSGLWIFFCMVLLCVFLPYLLSTINMWSTVLGS